MESTPAVIPACNAIDLRQSSIPSEHEMMVYQTMAMQAIDSKLYGGNHKDKSSVMMIMLSARELGIPPMQALNGGLNLINGKVEISARMMSALIRKAGHYVSVKESTDLSCTITGKRADTGETQIASFSVAEAQKAGLVKQGGGWTKWPKDMCFARALSRLARQLFSDVIGIGYVEGEIRTDDVKMTLSEEPFIEYLPPEDETEWTNKFLAIFDLEDIYYATRYLKTVESHFGWSRIEAIKNLLNDEKHLKEKFLCWKTKIIKADHNEVPTDAIYVAAD